MLQNDALGLAVNGRPSIGSIMRPRCSFSCQATEKTGYLFALHQNKSTVVSSWNNQRFVLENRLFLWFFLWLWSSGHFKEPCAHSFSHSHVIPAGIVLYPHFTDRYCGVAWPEQAEQWDRQSKDLGFLDLELLLQMQCASNYKKQNEAFWHWDFLDSHGTMNEHLFLVRCTQFTWLPPKSHLFAVFLCSFWVRAAYSLKSTSVY